MPGNAKSRRSLLENWAALYSNNTESERLIEPYIAALGVRYRAQHIFWGLRIIPDFVLLDYACIIEIDDPSHNTAYKKAKDKEKTAKLLKQGWKVCRTTNAAVEINPAAALKEALKQVGLDHLIKE
jgi:very-short-patch-repair endonuclease